MTEVSWLWDEATRRWLHREMDGRLVPGTPPEYVLQARADAVKGG